MCTYKDVQNCTCTQTLTATHNRLEKLCTCNTKQYTVLERLASLYDGYTGVQLHVYHSLRSFLS